MPSDTQPSDSGEPRLEREVYLQERRDLNQAEAEQSRSFDKAVLTLSAGALGISITFIRDVVPVIRPCTGWVLYVGWAAFVASLLVTLWSFLTSMKALRRQLEILDAVHMGLGAPNLSDNAPARLTNRLNYLSFLLFIAGAAALTLFVAINIDK